MRLVTTSSDLSVTAILKLTLKKLITLAETANTSLQGELKKS